MAVTKIAKEAEKFDAKFFIVGDVKSPSDFCQPGAVYFDIEAQRQMRLRYPVLAPERHYARKNVGYLAAIRAGADVIVETDDDNIPRNEFWHERQATVLVRTVSGSDWINVYSYFSDELIWPRGLPLTAVRGSERTPGDLPMANVYCPIQQGLADENPDVDAIYRLLFKLPINFQRRDAIALRGPWSPFNSQNTTWFADAFPLLYLPSYCSFRMTDIWRSFIAQRIAYLNDWAIMYHNPTVYQERNYHDLLRDFEDEVPGYLNNGKIKTILCELPLEKGAERIPDAMRACYGRLCELELFDGREIALLDAWFEDFRAIRSGC